MTRHITDSHSRDRNLTDRNGGVIIKSTIFLNPLNVSERLGVKGVDMYLNHFHGWDIVNIVNLIS